MTSHQANPTAKRTGERRLCQCFNMNGSRHGRRDGRLHNDVQDTACPGWTRVLQNVEDASKTRVESFSPLEGLSDEEREDVVTLPPSIGILRSVRVLRLYGSNIVRIPPEIGEMESLELLDIYTSYRLHYLPFEVTRCARLCQSRASTRALYGNYKFRAPFPDLLRAANVDAAALSFRNQCSVCGVSCSLTKAIWRWLSLRVGTDVFPLLVASCSSQCLEKLPLAPADYVQKSHSGGHRIVQPQPRL